MNTEIFRQDVNFVVLRQIELAFHSSLPSFLSSAPHIHFDHPGRGRRWKEGRRREELITDADEIIWN